MSRVGFRESIKTILWGVLWVVGACWFYFALGGNPLAELALIQRARIAPGSIVDTWEEYDGESDAGQDLWSHGSTYTYRLPDGREFTQSTEGWGQLKDAFFDLQEPYPVEVEYLPEDPKVSRIRGDGSSSVREWIWRQGVFGSLLLALFLSPGIVLLRNGLRQLKRRDDG